MGWWYEDEPSLPISERMSCKTEDSSFFISCKFLFMTVGFRIITASSNSNISHFALVAVFQSIFQSRQHHVNIGLAAVAPHQTNTQHLKRQNTLVFKEPFGIKRSVRRRTISYQTNRWSKPSRNF